MRGKQLLQSIFLLLFSILLLVVTTLAWFSYNVNPEVNLLVTSVGKYQIDIKIEVSKNNQGYQEVQTEAEMAAILDNTIPGDTYDFRLSFTNNGTSNAYIDVVFDNIINIPYQNSDANMLEVFLIDSTRLSELVNGGNSWYAAHEIHILQSETETFSFRLKYDEETSDLKYQQGKIKINSITIYVNSEG